MAFFGSSVGFGGLFGSSGQSSATTQIVGIDYSLISASVDAKLAQRALASLSAEDRAAFNFKTKDDGTIPPWQQTEETQTLNEQIRKVRELTQFIDLSDKSLKAVSNDPDKQATFALYKALNNLRILAEYASQDATTTSSLARLNTQFQSGLSEIQDFLSSASLNKLDLFLGEKRYTVDSAIRTGKNSTGFDGSLVTKSPSEPLTGLTGTEVFTVSITKSGVTDNIEIDLSQISGDLSLKNIKDYINSQIEALTITNGQGEEVAKHQTRFDIHRDGTTGKYGLQIDGTLTEEVSFSAAVSEPTLYVASSVSQLDDSTATTSRLTEINGLSGTLKIDDITSFAGIDVDASAIKELVDDTEEDELDPKLASMRDKFRADALAAVTDTDTSDDEEEEDVDATSLTNINSDYKVNADTSASRVAVDSEGGIYVVGTSSGSFGHQINEASGEDVFLTKFDNEGNVVFSRLLGVSGNASAYGITVDDDDNVIIVGQTDSALSTSDVIDSKDAFVTKISKRGDEVFRYQLDTYGESAAYSVAVDSSGDIFVGGYTKSSISATSGFSGGQDALILKLSGTNGKLLDSNVFGTSGNDVIKGIAVDANDNLVVAAEQSGSAIVYRIDGSDLTNRTSSVNYGYLGSGGSIQNLTIDKTNNTAFIGGVTTNTNLNASGAATVNESAKGGFEGFVSGLSLDGTDNLTANFTTYLSTSGTDRIADVVVVDNVVYVAGSTAGTLTGEKSRGATDAFVARLDGATGALGDVEQFGESLSRQTSGGLAFTTKGNSVLSTLGLPTGTVAIDQTLDIQTQTSAKVGDYFYFQVDGSTKKKITLEDGDTLTDIARKIKVAALGKLKVEISSTSEGDKIKISALNDGKAVDLIAGKNGDDLLTRLGIEPGKLLPRDEVYGINEEEVAPEDDLGGVFGLKLGGALHIGDKATAKYVLGLLDDAISTVQRAYRSLTYNPLVEQLKNGNKNKGTVSPQQQKQLANFQTGLARLQSGASSPTYSLFA
ncbi:MAG: hypothetical protein EP335_00100 [Alphaproteobacteria bacterium]|nr:MAG: hypothetical protein EP335_00100 [Alphaproteobacteria bacterium]